MRTRVNFTACIRVNRRNEEVVECDNVSKGGLCFRSRKQCSVGAPIEVAVQVRRVEELSNLGLFRYGVAYT